MALIKGICKNFGECDLADSKEVQEVDKTNFVCEECGKPLHLLDSAKSSKGKRPDNNKLIIIIAAVVVLIALIGGFYVLGQGDAKPEPESAVAAPVDNDSIKAAQQRADSIEAARVAAEQQRIKDSLDAATKAVEQEKNKSKHGQNPQPTNSGTKDLGYAIFKGTLKNGKPDAVNGRLIFKVAHLIDSRDSKQRMAEAGDYIIGEFSEGHLVQGIWYSADNQVKGSVIIGK